MRIKKFETNGFGCLKGSYQFGPLPSTLIIEKNEKGKSTLVAGILAALYGLDENGSHGLQEKERFRPMKWKEFDVTLAIQIGEREYRIVRDFNTGSVGVWDEKTGQEITAEFEDKSGQMMIGESLIDLSRDGFLKTALIRQHEIQTLRKPSHIAEKIEAMIDTLSGDATARQALALLTEARDAYRGNTSLESEIDELRERLKDYRNQWDALEEKRENLDEKVARLLELGQRRGDLRASLDRTRYAAMMSQRRILKGKVSQYEEKRSRLRKLESEVESLREIASFPSNREKDLTDAVHALAAMDRRIATLRADLEGTRKRIEAADRRISQEFGPLASLTEDELSGISLLMKTLQKDLSMLPEIRGACSAEKNLIIQEGYRLKDYADLKKKVGTITDEEKSNVVRYQESSGVTINEMRSLKRDIRLYEEKVEKTENELKRTKKSRNRVMLFGGFLLLLTAGIYVLERGPYQGILVGLQIDLRILQAICGGVGLLVVFWGLIRSWRGRRGKMEAWSHDVERIESLLVKRDKMEKQFQADKAGMEKLASQRGLRSSEELWEELKQFERLDERTARLRTLLARVKEIKSRIAGNRSKMAAYMKGVGEKPEEQSWAGMVRLCKKVEAYTRVRSERNGAQERRTKLEKEIQGAERGKKEKSELVASILNESGIVWDGNGDNAIKGFTKELERFHRFVRLKDELIPQAQLDQIPEETYESIVSALKGVEGSMGEIERRYPEVEKCVSEDDGRPENTVEERKAEMERISEERQGLRHEIAQFLERYGGEVARLQQDMGICRRNLERAEFSERAVRLAIQYLESVRRELHHRCAEFLNQRANTVLSHLIPICESIEIKPDLSFSITHRGLRTTLDQTHVDGLLSVGARDQIYLALRLAISQYLSSSGIHLPVILDDALITSDDDRFVDTMNFVLKELTGNHQIIILTCHEKRHQWWLDHIPKDYRNRIQISRLQNVTHPQKNVGIGPS